MGWIIKFLTSSIGKKIIMSLTGIFLITFLPVHLAGNFLLLGNDGGEAFNSYAYFMTTNPLIKFISIGLYFFIILHAVQGIIIALSNRKAKGSRYQAKPKKNATWASKNMALLGTLILAFIFIHMGDFWFKMKFTDQLSMIEYQGMDVQVKDLYNRVEVAFNQPWIVIAYIIGLIALSFHLLHGFASAFDTLGLRHKKYTPIINIIGTAYSILIPLGYAIIPLYMLFK